MCYLCLCPKKSAIFVCSFVCLGTLWRQNGEMSNLLPTARLSLQPVSDVLFRPCWQARLFVTNNVDFWFGFCGIFVEISYEDFNFIELRIKFTNMEYEVCYKSLRISSTLPLMQRRGGGGDWGAHLHVHQPLV